MTSLNILLLQSLQVRIDLQPIETLLQSARKGFRLYELFRLTGAEQLIEYVDIEFQSHTPQDFNWWLHFLINEDGPSSMRSKITELPWEQSFKKPGAEKDAWEKGAYFNDALRQAVGYWSDVESTRAFVLSQDDPLMKYELVLIQGFNHPNDLAQKEENISEYLSRFFRFSPAQRYSDNFYALLTDIIAMPQIHAFTHRGRGDWLSIKNACAEQLKRCSGQNDEASEKFPVKVLTPWSGGSFFDCDDDSRISLNPYPAWTEQVRFQFEGLEPEGLFFDEGGEYVGGLSFAESERKELKRAVVVVVTTNLSPGRTSLRTWLSHESGVFLGIDKTRMGEFSRLVPRHELKEI